MEGIQSYDIFFNFLHNSLFFRILQRNLNNPIR